MSVFFYALACDLICNIKIKDMTLAEILAKIGIVKNESNPNANTASRVGQALEDLANYIPTTNETNASIAKIINDSNDQGSVAPLDTDVLNLGKGSSLNKWSILNFKNWLNKLYVGTLIQTFTNVEKIQIRKNIGAIRNECIVFTISGNEPNFDFVNNKITFYATSEYIKKGFDSTEETYIQQDSGSAIIDISANTVFSFVFFNKIGTKPEIYNYNDPILRTKINDNNLFFIGTFWKERQIVFMNGDYKINGVLKGTPPVTPNFNVVQRDIQPIALSGGSISKSGSTYTITGNVGFLHGKKKYSLVKPGSYVLGSLDCLTVLNVDITKTYDGINNPVLIPTIKQYNLVDQYDVVLAWKSQNSYVTSIWDMYLSNVPMIPTIVTKPDYVAFTNVGSVWKLNTTLIGIAITLNGAEKSNLAANITFTDAYTYLIIDFTDGSLIAETSSVNANNYLIQNSRYILMGRVYPKYNIFDMRCAYSVNGAPYGIVTSITNVVPYITTPHIDKTPLSSIFQKIYNQENLRVLLTGDSIFESSNIWAWGQFPFGTAFSTKIGLDNSQPYQLTDKILSRKLYDLLMKHSINTPVYKRFDFGQTFDYNSSNGTFGTDLTPANKFFTENGVFGTWVSSDGNGITSSEYGTLGASAQIPMTLADATSAFVGASWYSSGANEGFTRKSTSANAYVEFTVPAGYSKIRIKIRKTTDGDLLTNTLTNCTGAATIDSAYGPVTHNNNSNFMDVEFTVINTGLATVIRLTKSSNTSKCLAYWGAFYYNEPCTIVNNYSYGGCRTPTNYNVLPDLLKESYDLIIWEIQLLNDIYGTYATSKTAIQAICTTLLAYGKPILAVIPQRGSNEGVLAADKMWGMAKSVLLSNNIPFIDLGVIESSVIQQIGRTPGLTYIYGSTGGVHPNSVGVDTLGIMFNSLFNN